MALVPGKTSKEGFLLVAQTKHWHVWSPPTFFDENKDSFSPERIDYLDAMVEQLEKDLGYSMLDGPIKSSDGTRLDCVLDPTVEGAHTGTIFGEQGVSIAPSLISEPFLFGDTMIERFWWYVLMAHQTTRLWLFSVAKGWPFSDVFEDAFTIVTTMELAQTFEASLISVSGALSSLALSNRDYPTQLLYGIQKTYGWIAYQSLIESVVEAKISDWSVYDEPLRTAILVWFLSCGSANFNLVPTVRLGGERRGRTVGSHR